MKVLNIMLSRDLGGIQQSFLDYADALTLEGFGVINITSFFAKVNKSVQKTIKLPNLGPWDIISALYLKLIIYVAKPDIVIAHGNRAIIFSRGVRNLIGVAHNYNIKWLKKCNYVIALTEHMKNHLVKEKFAANKIEVIPNMIHLTHAFAPKFHTKTPIIGAIGRFVPKKGIDIFLHSLAKLKERKYVFTAIIGGDGVEKNNLIELSKKLYLEKEVRFCGWVNDKDEFFNNISIFCLPSLHEPFGIIALEAMAHRVPIVATKTEGPLEILVDKESGLLCDIGSSEDLAKKLAYLLDNLDKVDEYVKSSYLRLQENYDIRVVAKKLSLFIQSVNK
jgi:glycosyltransferase involved in cell wall biosynthesis